MARLTKKEKALLQAIVDTSVAPIEYIMKNPAHSDGYRFLWLYHIEDCDHSLSLSHPLNPRLFSKLKVDEKYSVEELLEEE